MAAPPPMLRRLHYTTVRRAPSIDDEQLRRPLEAACQTPSARQPHPATIAAAASSSFSRRLRAAINEQTVTTPARAQFVKIQLNNNHCVHHRCCFFLSSRSFMQLTIAAAASVKVWCSFMQLTIVVAASVKVWCSFSRNYVLLLLTIAAAHHRTHTEEKQGSPVKVRRSSVKVSIGLFESVVVRRLVRSS